MTPTLAQLVAAGVAPTQARLALDPLDVACAQFQINTPARVAGFVAQCNVESNGFTLLEENLYYTTAERIRAVFPTRVTSLGQASLLVRNPQGLANAVYSSKNGNGNPMTGDGWIYRGRGPIQITGRNNYADAQAELNRPYLAQPDLVAALPDGMLTAAWFWSTQKCNLLADSAQWDAITRAINGPMMLRADLRKQLSEEGVRAFTA